MNKSRIYLVSPDDVKAASQINYNADDIIVSSAIRSSQDIYLREIIGDRLLGSIQEKVEDKTIENPENEAYLTLLDEYIFNFLIYKANVEICIPISLKIRNIGISQDYDSNITAAQIETIEKLCDFYETQADDRQNRLIDFLVENRATFPELNLQCGCGEKAPCLKKTANTQLYLGI